MGFQTVLCLIILLYVSKSQLFFPIWIIIVLVYRIWETCRNKLKNHPVSKIVLTFQFNVRKKCSSDLKAASNFWINRKKNLTEGQNFFENKRIFEPIKRGFSKLYHKEWEHYFWFGDCFHKKRRGISYRGVPWTFVINTNQHADLLNLFFV